MAVVVEFEVIVIDCGNLVEVLPLDGGFVVGSPGFEVFDVGGVDCLELFKGSCFLLMGQHFMVDSWVAKCSSSSGAFVFLGQTSSVMPELVHVEHFSFLAELFLSPEGVTVSCVADFGGR